jgi:hypothetical protein
MLVLPSSADQISEKTAIAALGSGLWGVNPHRAITPLDFVHKLLKHIEKERIFRDLFGVQSQLQRK